MHLRFAMFCGLLLVAGCSSHAAESQRSRTITVFEGARLLLGDSTTPIANSAFVVENDKFTQVGARGEVNVPAGAARVDLSGKTVMPALIDAHSHIGYMKV